MSRPVLRATELQLLVAPSLMTIVGLLTIFLVPRGTTSWTWRDIGVSLTYVAVVVAVSAAFSLFRLRGDQLLLPLTAALAALGLLAVQRLYPVLAARGPAYLNLAERQLIYLLLGFALFAGTALFFRRFDWLRRYKYTWLLLTILLLAVTFVFGVEINGARLWLSIGPFQAQPSELVKVTLVSFLAAYLDDKRELVRSTWRLGPFDLPPVPVLLPMALMGVASLGVLVVQNDLGSALLFFGVFLAMLYVATGRVVEVVVGLALFAAAAWGAYRVFDRIGVRVQNWLDPWHDALGVGYQQVQSDYALAAGGVLGPGLGRGEPYHIPEVQTDFVFSALGEELGLAGSLAILALLLLLVLRGFAVGLAARDGFSQLLAIGLSAAIGVQALIILGGVVRLIPLTGITVPFVSYGGSSLLTNFFIVGLLLAISAASRRQ